ncbi:hypothetical protein GLAREA_03311 [Glarea lozoyensis ATCC 20868]|uniref:Uncharacterized protein n=1 Tax=Glarea lozoyensis (strain ATCC 20868 / MF5171) TaxID=1116229 RepID=S3CZM9_GLAL2|nr:uncharacterized protein GLAREA_03311 [Glarea lozoyensis ATCC 20868]EPE30344.1 hypothetical protein GLAREA_03311 [Glarea lozoyensis ATCC 20868]
MSGPDYSSLFSYGQCSLTSPQDTQKIEQKGKSGDLLHKSNAFFLGLPRYKNPPPKAEGEDDENDGLIDLDEATRTPLGNRNSSSAKTHKDESDDLIFLPQRDTKSQEHQNRSFASIETAPDSAVSHIGRPQIPVELDSWDAWNSLAIRKPRCDRSSSSPDSTTIKRFFGTKPHSNLISTIVLAGEAGEAQFLLLRLGNLIVPAATSRSSHVADFLAEAGRAQSLDNGQFDERAFYKLLSHLQIIPALEDMDPAAHGLLTSFPLTHPRENLKNPSGQRATDSVSWNEGFNTRVFSISARHSQLPLRNSRLSSAVLCPYKLRGTWADHESYTTTMSSWNRRRIAFDQINNALHPVNYQAPQAPEFSKLARAFFGGLPVPEDINEDTREQNPTPTTRELEDGIVNNCGDSVHEESATNSQKPENVPHVTIRFSTGAFSEVLRERPIEDKSLICFLQDCAIANVLEEACVARKPLPSGVKVYRTDQFSWVRDSPFRNIVSFRSEKQYNEVSANTTSDSRVPTIRLSTSEFVDFDAVLKKHSPTDALESNTKAKTCKNHQKSKDAKKKKPRARVTSKQENNTVDDENGGGTDTDHSTIITDRKTLLTKAEQPMGSDNSLSNFGPPAPSLNIKDVSGDSLSEPKWEIVKPKSQRKPSGQGDAINRSTHNGQRSQPVQSSTHKISIKTKAPVTPLVIKKNSQSASGNFKVQPPMGPRAVQNQASASHSQTSQSPKNNHQKLQTKDITTKVVSPEDFPALGPSPSTTIKRPAETCHSKTLKPPRNNHPQTCQNIPKSDSKGHLSGKDEIALKTSGKASSVVSSTADDVVSVPCRIEHQMLVISKESEQKKATSHKSAIFNDDTVSPVSCESPNTSADIITDDRPLEASAPISHVTVRHSEKTNEQPFRTGLVKAEEKIDDLNTSPSTSKHPVSVEEVVAPHGCKSPETARNYSVSPTRNHMDIASTNTISNNIRPCHDVQNTKEYPLPPGPNCENQCTSENDIDNGSNLASLGQLCTSIPVSPSSGREQVDKPDHHSTAISEDSKVGPASGEDENSLTGSHCPSDGWNQEAIYPSNIENGTLPPSAQKVINGDVSDLQPTTNNHNTMAIRDRVEPRPLSGFRKRPRTAHTAFRCSLCLESGFATLSAPLVLCPGCGPLCNIRYCSVACLLANAYDHAHQCMNFPASQRLAYHNLPLQYVYEKDPIMPINPWTVVSAEQFRQKAFSMYGSLSLFQPDLNPDTRRPLPKHRVTGLSVFSNKQILGEYHVFRSATTTAGYLLQPKAEVIFTVCAHNEGHYRGILRRALNASYLLPQIEVLEFIFRLIRSYIFDDEFFNNCTHSASDDVVFEEFRHQFSKEFDLSPENYEHEPPQFDVENALETIIPCLDSIEMRYPILQYWRR